MASVDFWWAGQPLGLSLAQPQRSDDALYEVQWGPEGPLGVSLSVDALSSRVVIVRSSRLGVEVGDVLLRASGLELRGDNLEDAMATMMSLHDVPGQLVELKFEKRPMPVVVSSLDPQSPIAKLGVSGDASFELLSVNDRPVKYLEMDELHQLLLKLPKPCLLRFQRVQGDQVSREQQTATAAQDGNFQRQRSKSQSAKAAAAAAGLAIAAAMSVTLS